MTYTDSLNAGQGAKLMNQDIFGCLVYDLDSLFGNLFNDFKNLP